MKVGGVPGFQHGAGSFHRRCLLPKISARRPRATEYYFSDCSPQQAREILISVTGADLSLRAVKTKRRTTPAKISDIDFEIVHNPSIRPDFRVGEKLRRSASVVTVALPGKPEVEVGHRPAAVPVFAHDTLAGGTNGPLGSFQAGQAPFVDLVWALTPMPTWLAITSSVAKIAASLETQR
jgi:hypothetical protein